VVLVSIWCQLLLCCFPLLDSRTLKKSSSKQGDKSTVFGGAKKKEGSFSRLASAFHLHF
jgi:hypothetical protein